MPVDRLMMELPQGRHGIRSGSRRECESSVCDATIGLNIRICSASARRIACDEPIQPGRAQLSLLGAAVPQQQFNPLAHAHRSESRPSASLPEFLGLL